LTERLALFCKSFRDDFDRLGLLLHSARQHAGGYAFILSIPRGDLAALRERIGVPSHIKLIFDEDYAPAESNALPGWLQQQVCKLSLHRTGLADSYLVIDSDSYLVAPVADSDFLAGGRRKIVYSSLFTGYYEANVALSKFLTETDEAHAEALASRRYCKVAPGTTEGIAARLAEYRAWLAAEKDPSPMDRGPWINKVFKVQAGTAFQPGQILHAALLAEMETFFAGLGISLADLIRLAPWEYNWYACWAASARPDEVEPSISPILHFASREAVDHARRQRITPAIIAKRFKIIQMAARHFDDRRF